MPKDGRSFFEKLTGSVRIQAPAEEDLEMPGPKTPSAEAARAKNDWLQPEEDGELTVDMMQTPDEIIIQSMVAGVKPDDLDVTITRDMVTLKGRRQKNFEASGKDYFYQELYWGSFSRSILLPQEVDADEAQATLKNGLLTIKLPKLDKSKTQKLKVKME
ncbi:Hsp20/alpha crystallin family protein [Candidatus Giovannonibacteria bacterium]|nr:Hsp20/alpha crystallin family protein [Candidatus Giovannonibacteria bacterium]